ncbi:MAG: META domain-containing protein [Pyrinomonadaceae bacterium]
MKLLKIKYLNFLLIALVTFVLQSNVFAQNRTEFIVVADEMSDCRNSRNEKCLQIRKPHENSWKNLDGRILNFKYQPGFFYLLEVREVNSRNRQNNDYRLVRILYRERSLNEPGNNSKLGNRKWILTKIGGVNVNTNRAFIQFEEDKDRFGGSGGCNGMGGNLEVNGSTIDLSQIISTKMYCEATSEIENKFFNELESVNRFEIKGKSLFLYNGRRVALELRSES